MTSRARILLYSHDTFGLGHLRRSLTIAERLARDIRKSHQLLITGSMVAGAFRLPPRLDTIKLPALSKRSSGVYTTRALPTTLKQTLAWREQMILQAVQNFQPDLVLVDKSPAGVHGEMLPALRHLKTWSPDTRLVLGLRDIEDAPGTTQAEWTAAGVYPLLEEVYDSILHYGQRDVFDPVTAYALSDAVAAKITPCGYLGREQLRRDSAWVRRELDLDAAQPLVVVTVGGGGDGFELIRRYVDMLAAYEGEIAFHSLVVTGPLMAQSKRRLLRRAATLPNVTLRHFTPELMSYLGAADLVIGMAGYNTVCELLSLRKRALLVPRQSMRAEQAMRAERLAARGLVQTRDVATLTPGRFLAAVRDGLAAPAPDVDLDLDGLHRVSAAIADLLDPAGRRAAPAAQLAVEVV